MGQCRHAGHTLQKTGFDRPRDGVLGKRINWRGNRATPNVQGSLSSHVLFPHFRKMRRDREGGEVCNALAISCRPSQCPPEAQTECGYLLPGWEGATSEPKPPRYGEEASGTTQTSQACDSRPTGMEPTILPCPSPHPDAGCSPCYQPQR